MNTAELIASTGLVSLEEAHKVEVCAGESEVSRFLLGVIRMQGIEIENLRRERDAAVRIGEEKLLCAREAYADIIEQKNKRIDELEYEADCELVDSTKRASSLITSAARKASKGLSKMGSLDDGVKGTITQISSEMGDLLGAILAKRANMFNIDQLNLGCSDVKHDGG